MFKPVLFDTEQISQLDTPSLDIESAFSLKDELHLKFLQEILGRCDAIKFISLKSSDVLKWLLESMRPLIKNIMSVQFSDTYLSIAHFDKDAVEILIKNGSIEDFDAILNYYTINNFSVHLYAVNPPKALGERHATNLRSLFSKKQREQNSPSFIHI